MGVKGAPMHIQLLAVPYDSGHYDTRMGRGPTHLVARGVVPALEARGHTVSLRELRARDAFPREIGTAFDLARQLAEQVREACAGGAFPLVLAGNCNTALGTLAGIGSAETAVIWLDAHGEFNTPETTTGGFLDGMGLAIATGHCWRPLAASIPSFQPLPGAHLLLLGARDLDDPERPLIERAGVRMIAPAALRDRNDATLADALAALPPTLRGAYVHLDLDVLDPSVGPANGYAAPDGLLVDDVRRALELVQQRLPILAATVASYDPAHDRDDRVLGAALELAPALVPHDAVGLP
jgi:arginase